MVIKDGSVPGIVKMGMEKDLRPANMNYKIEQTDSYGNSRIYNNESIIDKYRDVLIAQTRLYSFNKADIEKYRYRPRSFCLDNYGDADLWSVLLRMNNMLTCTDFNRITIRVFNSKFIPTLKTLLMLEEDQMVKVVKSI